jgi:hypothetical protein
MHKRDGPALRSRGPVSKARVRCYLTGFFGAFSSVASSVTRSDPFLHEEEDVEHAGVLQLVEVVGHFAKTRSGFSPRARSFALMLLRPLAICSASACASCSGFT